MKSFVLAAAALGLVSTTAPAFADQRERMTIKVELDDINLGTAAGQKVLDQRIERAVRTVCRTNDLTTGSRVLTQEKRDCLVRARAEAREKVAVVMGDLQRGG
jgi:UrcA family protein